MITSNGISNVTFYGKKPTQLSIKVQLSRREKEFKKWPAPTPYQPKLRDPSSYWQIFKTQKDAFNFARSVSCDLHVFSCESETFYNKNGQRFFLVTSYDQFWHYYRQLGNRQRHHYEVIPEGSVCHLYFDLEFLKVFNQHRDGAEITDIFIKYINSQLEDIFHVTCSRENVLQLDSSTEYKFSQHLIYHLDNTVFKDNIEAGYFVNLVCNQLVNTLKEFCSNEDTPLCKKIKRATSVSYHVDDNASPLEDDVLFGDTISQRLLTRSGLCITDLQKLLVKDKDGLNVLFCDQGVYTRNRNFRLYLSCKLGKNNPLVIAKNNKWLVSTPSDRQQSSEEQIFLDSLITNIKYEPTLQILSMPSRLKLQKQTTTREKKNVEESLNGYQSSPYPELDSYITSRLTRDGKQGVIRRWTYFSSEELMVYDIAKNRWCENIGRQHKSNNVIYVADIKRGVYYQKCHDPQCKAINFKSKEYPLPKDVLPASYFEIQDEFLEDLDLDDLPDVDLLLAASQVELVIPDNVDNDHSERDEKVMFDDVSDEELLQAVQFIDNECDNKYNV